MGDLFGMVLIRSLVRFIGLHVRYAWFKIIQSPKSIKSLSNTAKSDYDLGPALKQDLLNAIVGSIVLIIISLIIVGIVFG